MFRVARAGVCRWRRAPCSRQRCLGTATRAIMAPAPGERAVVDNIGLELEEIDKNLFRSKSLWTPAGARGVYGGQVIGQALMAAHATLDDDIPIHSMHSYFLLPGDATRPILYSVNRLRDGKSFTARSVIAKQNGTPIFNCQASFHRPEASPICHQDPMPDAPPPESVPSFDDQLRGLLAEPGLKGRYRAVIQKLLEHPFGMEVRNVTVPDIRKPPAATTTQLMWMRTASPMGDNRNLHKCTVAFASDWGLGVTSLLPHGVVFPSRAVKMVASLDHSVWFHNDNFRADEWMLYEMYTSRAHGGRGLNFGRLFNQQGELVMSFAQEAVIRMREPWVHGAADNCNEGDDGEGAPAAA